MMTKLEAIVQPSRFEAVKEVLTELGIGGMTISDVRGHGRQKGHTEVYRGREYTVDLLPKIKIEMVIPDNLVDAAIDAILQSASTGKIGDGKIFRIQSGSGDPHSQSGARRFRAVITGRAWKWKLEVARAFGFREMFDRGKRVSRYREFDGSPPE